MTSAHHRTPRAARIAVDGPVSVTRAGSRHGETARAEDLSRSGVFLTSSRPYVVGTSLRVVLSAGGGSIDVTGTVVRVGIGASGRVGMGVMFTHVDEATRAALDGLCGGPAPP